MGRPRTLGSALGGIGCGDGSLLKRPLNLTIKGVSAAGKTFWPRVSSLLPTDAVREISSMSAKALNYSKTDAERNTQKENHQQCRRSRLSPPRKEVRPNRPIAMFRQLYEQLSQFFESEGYWRSAGPRGPQRGQICMSFSSLLSLTRRGKRTGLVRSLRVQRDRVRSQD